MGIDEISNFSLFQAILSLCKVVIVLNSGVSLILDPIMNETIAILPRLDSSSIVNIIDPIQQRFQININEPMYYIYNHLNIIPRDRRIVSR